MDPVGNEGRLVFASLDGRTISSSSELWRVPDPSLVVFSIEDDEWIYTLSKDVLSDSTIDLRKLRFLGGCRAFVGEGVPCEGEDMSLYGIASNSLAGEFELKGEDDTKRKGEEEDRALEDEDEEEETDGRESNTISCR